VKTVFAVDCKNFVFCKKMNHLDVWAYKNVKGGK